MRVSVYVFISTHTLSHCRYLQLLFAHSAPLPCPVFSVCALLLCKSAAITLSNTLKLSHTHTHTEASANNAISHKSAYLIYKFSSAKFPNSQEHTHCPGTIVGCRNGDSGPVDHHTRGWCNCEQTKENKHIIIIIPRGRPGNYLCIMARCMCFCTCVCVREGSSSGWRIKSETDCEASVGIYLRVDNSPTSCWMVGQSDLRTAYFHLR